jgi:hypothetical protein
MGYRYGEHKYGEGLYSRWPDWWHEKTCVKDEWEPLACEDSPWQPAAPPPNPWQPVAPPEAPWAAAAPRPVMQTTQAMKRAPGFPRGFRAAGT